MTKLQYLAYALIMASFVAVGFTGEPVWVVPAVGVLAVLDITDRIKPQA